MNLSFRPTTHRRRVTLLLFAICLAILPASLSAQMGNDNPTGVAGMFNGNVNTAGSYDPYTGNATRSITDISVAGAVGTYPLAFTRTTIPISPATRTIFNSPGSITPTIRMALMRHSATTGLARLKRTQRAAAALGPRPKRAITTTAG
jgi:hypothetical protein